MINEGFHRAKALSFTWGRNTKDERCGRVNLEIVEGDNKGQRITKDCLVNEKALKYTRLDLMALGWDGASSRTAESQINAASEAGKVVDIEIKHVQWTDREGRSKTFAAVQSIGRSAQPLTPMHPDDLDGLDSALAEMATPARTDDDIIPF